MRLELWHQNVFLGSTVRCGVSVYAYGPDLSAGRKAALSRAERSLRKVRALAHRYGVLLNRDDMEVAPGGLTDVQRRALAQALADPVSCAFLANAALAQAQHGGAV